MPDLSIDAIVGSLSGNSIGGNADSNFDRLDLRENSHKQADTPALQLAV